MIVSTNRMAFCHAILLGFVALPGCCCCPSSNANQGATDELQEVVQEIEELEKQLAVLKARENELRQQSADSRGDDSSHAAGDSNDITQWRDISDKPAMPVVEIYKKTPHLQPETVRERKEQREWFDENVVGKVVEHTTTLKWLEGRAVQGREYMKNGKTFYRAEIRLTDFVEVNGQSYFVSLFNVPGYELVLLANGLSFEEVDQLENLDKKKVTIRGEVVGIESNFQMMLKNASINGLPLRTVHADALPTW